MDVFKCVKPHTWINKKSFGSAYIVGKAFTIYQVRQKTYAPQWLAIYGYHLLAFDIYANARDAITSYEWRNCEIWIAEIDERDIVFPLPPPCDSFDLESGVVKQVGASWPIGTLMVKSLILKEKAKYKGGIR